MKQDHVTNSYILGHSLSGMAIGFGCPCHKYKKKIKKIPYEIVTIIHYFIVYQALYAGIYLDICTFKIQLQLIFVRDRYLFTRKIKTKIHFF